MPKLTSKNILDIILPQLSTEKVKEDLIAFYDIKSCDVEKNWKKWTNKNQWKRFSKCKCKSEQGNDEFINFNTPTSYLVNDCGYPTGPCMGSDWAGDSNQELVTQIYIQNKQGDCLIRRFIPNNDFGDNFRLEVYTTPDDMEIIGWDVVVD